MRPTRAHRYLILAVLMAAAGYVDGPAEFALNALLLAMVFLVGRSDRDVQAQASAIIAGLTEGVAIRNAKGRLVDYNASAPACLGLSGDEYRKLTLDDPRWVYLDDEREHPSRRAVRTGVVSSNYVLGFRPTPDRLIYVRGTVCPFKIGRRSHVLVTTLDVTAEIEGERRLRERGEDLEFLFASMSEGMYRITRDGVMTQVNRAAAEMLGYTVEELEGRPAHQTIHHSHGDGSPFEIADCPLYLALRDGLAHDTPDDVFFRRDGTPLPVASRSIPLVRDGEVLGALVTFRDLTEVRRLEENVRLEQVKTMNTARLAELGEVSASIAHEINNPLAIILASLERLPLARTNADDFARRVQTMARATARIAKITRSLQRFARRRDDVARAPSVLGAIIEETLLMCEAKAHRNNVRIDVDVPANLELICNALEIEQVMINLVSNAVDAVKSLPDRWVKIEARVDQTDLVLSVTDAGPGLRPEVATKLFEPFFTTKAPGQGTGLGLSIVRQILTQHEASIRVDHAAPHTRFELRFPHWQLGVDVAA